MIMQDKITVKQAKKAADRLAERFATLGVKIKRTQALEAVAAIFGAENWNVFVAQIKLDEARHGRD